MRTLTRAIPACVLFLLTSCAQPQAPAEQKAAPAADQKPAAQVHGNLLQVMRGMLFPNSNVIFAVQGKNPTELKQAADPATATDPLLSTYGGWTAVENAGIAMAEAANVLSIPGRKCANGRDVPVNNPDWPQLVQGLRDAGMKAYMAGQSKNDDMILEAADAMTNACAACHDKYRDKGSDADRCM